MGLHAGGIYGWPSPTTPVLRWEEGRLRLYVTHYVPIFMLPFFHQVPVALPPIYISKNTNKNKLRTYGSRLPDKMFSYNGFTCNDVVMETKLGIFVTVYTLPSWYSNYHYDVPVLLNNIITPLRFQICNVKKEGDIAQVIFRPPFYGGYCVMKYRMSYNNVLFRMMENMWSYRRGTKKWGDLRDLQLLGRCCYKRLTPFLPTVLRKRLRHKIRHRKAKKYESYRRTP